MSVLYGREGQREWAGGGGPGEGKTHELVVFPSARQPPSEGKVEATHGARLALRGRGSVESGAESRM